MAYLIDTDILIYSLKNNLIVNDNFKKYINYPKYISVISYGELYFGARKSKNIEKNTAVVKRISEIFQIIEIDKNIMEVFGELKAKLQKTGSIIDDFDLIIGSTALSLNCILVTNNEKHFQQIKGLKIENWSTNPPENSI